MQAITTKYLGPTNNRGSQMGAASEAFFQAYVECALWSSTDNADDSGGEPLDANYSEDDIAGETLAEMRKDCDDFVDSNADALAESGLSEERQGHDFWLTRNGHGAGFWDEGIGELGDDLSAACKPYGSVDLMVCDDGKIRSF